MGRTKKIDYMRTEFLVDVVDNVIRSQEDGVSKLQGERTNIGGVYFEAEKVENNTYKVISRPNGRVDNAIKDHLYLIRNFEQQYGRVHEIKFMARGAAQTETEYRIPYVIDGDTLKPVNAWDNYQSFPLIYE